MKKATKLIYLTLILLFAGCGHTNELVNYNLNNKTFYFENSVDPDAQNVKVDFSSPLKVNVDLNTGKTKTIGGLFSAISAVSSAIISSTTKNKLENALNGSEMATYVSKGIEKTLTQFYNIKNVGSLNNNPNFIVETELTKIQLGSTKDGVGVLVNAKSRIMDKMSAKVIWEKKSSEIMPIHKATTYNDTKTNTRISSVISAAQLAGLSKEEIRTIVYNAATAIGKDIAETLRKDISDAR